MIILDKTVSSITNMITFKFPKHRMMSYIHCKFMHNYTSKAASTSHHILCQMRHKCMYVHVDVCATHKSTQKLLHMLLTGSARCQYIKQICATTRSSMNTDWQMCSVLILTNFVSSASKCCSAIYNAFLNGQVSGLPSD